MKRYLAIGLLLVSSASVAIECGPSMRAALINQLEGSVRAASERLSQHSAALIKEMQRLLTNAKSNGDTLAFERVEVENGQLSRIIYLGDRIAERLSAASMLVQIRDGMVNVKDKTLVSAHLSIELSRTQKMGENMFKDINSTLTALSRPGVAIDVAKLRDAIDVVVKTLAICTPPPQSVSR